jgi:hypothetical protein
VLLDQVEHVDQHRGRHVVRLQTEIDQGRVGGVVIVPLLLLPRVGDRTNGHVQSQLAACLDNPFGELDHAEGLGELVHDPQLAAARRVGGSQLDALQRVVEIEVAAGLAAAAIDGQRDTGHGLDEEAIDDRAEDVVVVKVGQQAPVGAGLGGAEAIDRALHQVGDPKPVQPDVEPEQIGIEDFRRVVERAGRAREQEAVLPALVRDLDPALLDVDVGRAVLAHGAELDDVAVGRVLEAGPDRVEGGFQVVAQGAPRRVEAHHRVGRGRLLGIVDHEVRPHVGEQGEHQRRIGAVADHGLDRAPGHLTEDRGSVGQVRARDQRLRAGLQRHVPAQVVVDRPDLVSPRGESHGRWPAEIAVAAEHDDAHGLLHQSRNPLARRNSRSSWRVIGVTLAEL